MVTEVEYLTYLMNVYDPVVGGSLQARSLQIPTLQ
jgi:hypothetical protein